MALRYDAGEVITAMVTPFNSKREIDYNKAEELAKYLITHGSDALLVAGTTGEGPTLTHEEEFELLSTIKRAVANKASYYECRLKLYRYCSNGSEMGSKRRS